MNRNRSYCRNTLITLLVMMLSVPATFGAGCVECSRGDGCCLPPSEAFDECCCCIQNEQGRQREIACQECACCDRDSVPVRRIQTSNQLHQILGKSLVPPQYAVEVARNLSIILAANEVRSIPSHNLRQSMLSVWLK